ncbi:MAG: molecular chaperone GroEL, partial [Planctomycetota bacterium]|nr:molecular chaperone GroEL [Planctomycetota bacterium]
GVDILRDALYAPLKQIAENAGENGALVAKRIEGGENNYGFDAERLVYCDMFEAGIIDPTKVVRSALENAASVATMLLTTGCLVTEVPKKEEEKMPGMGGGGMGGMGGMDY